MIFGFRWMRAFQVVLALAAMATGIGAALCLKAFGDGASAAILIAAVLLGLAFLWSFAAALRAPTSFVAIAPERTRFRFAGLVDTVVDNRDILGARLVRHPWWGGLGIRTNFGGTVALASAWGPVAELTLRQPVRVWLLPGILPVRARKLRLSVRNPEKLVDRFGPPPAEGATVAQAGGGRRRRQGR